MTEKEMSKGKNLSPPQSLIEFIQEARANSKAIHDQERKRQYSSGEYFLHILQKKLPRKIKF